MPVSKARDIATSIGRAVIADTISSTGTISSSASFTVYDSAGDLPSSGVDAGSQAYVSSNQRLYIRGSGGWYSIATVNNTPVISSIVDSNGFSSPFSLATDGTATTITITATDSEGFPITYTATADSDFNGLASLTSDSSVFTITPFSEDSATTTSGTITFKASDGVNIASELTTFTLEFKVANSNATTLLVKATGNSGTNTSITDSSTNAHTVSVYGNTQATSFSPYRPGGYSYYFDGNSSDLEITADSTLAATTNTSWTFEGWFYRTGTLGDNGIVVTVGAGGSSTRWGLYIGYTNGTVLAKFGTGSWAWPYNYTSPNDVISLNTWHHVAVVRDGSTSLKIFVDGVLVLSNTSANFGSGISGTFYLGSYYNNRNNDDSWYHGYMKDVRMVQGTAVYTSDFTPPTEPLTAITNTSLLTCHLPRITDGSTNNHTLTVGGNTSPKPFSPYNYQKYSASTHGGSVYFDGSGDSLGIADDASLEVGSGDFTLEGWFYPTTTGYGVIVSKTSPAYAPYWVNINSGTIYFYASSTNGGWDVSNGTTFGSPKINTWNHFAVSRSGTSIRLFLNGVLGNTVTYSGALTDHTSPFTVGGQYGGANAFTGYVSDIRLVKGTAVYTAAFTPPTEPLTAITNTSVLISGTDAKVYDASQSSGTLTLNGDAASSTTQTKYASSSIYFDGSDHISIPSDDRFVLASGDFTVEMWVYIVSTSDSYGRLIECGAYNISGTWRINYNNTASSLVFQIGAPSSRPEITTSTALTLNTWYHIAVVRSGNTIKMFVNGTQEGGDLSYSGSFVGPTFDEMLIGTGVASSSNNTLQNFFNGYLEDLRITKGLARYTSSFTPPTSPLKG